jgi:hypothetical protein
MNRIMKLALCWAFLVFLVAAPCSAAIYTFDDLYKEWPGISTPLNDKDIHGAPSLKRVEVTTDDADRSLTTIKIVFDKEFKTPDFEGGGVGLGTAGDFCSLFINSNWSGAEKYDVWDFYVYGINTGSDYGASLYNLTEDWFYKYAVDAGYRIGHPCGIDVGTNEALLGYLTDFDVTYGDPLDPTVTESDITFTFAPAKIILGENFVIGYTPYCANDVFLAPVPEPTTFLLLGAGLAMCLCVLRGRKTIGSPDAREG